MTQNNGNIPEGTLTKIGSVTRFCIGEGPKEEGPYTGGPKVVLGGNAYVMNTGDGEGGNPVQRGPRAFSPATAENGLEGFLSTGKNPLTGAKISGLGDVKDNTEFIIDGISMPATSAARAGYLVKENDGYRLPTVSERDSKDDSEDDSNNNSGADFLPTQVKGVLSEIDARLGNPESTDTMIASVLWHQAEGDTGKAVDSVVRRTGIDPAIAQSIVEGAYKDAYNGAVEYVKRTFDVDGEAVFDYIAQALPVSQRSSLMYRMYLNDASAFAECVQRYQKAGFLQGCRDNQYLPEEGDE